MSFRSRGTGRRGPFGKRPRLAAALAGVALTTAALAATIAASHRGVSHVRLQGSTGRASAEALADGSVVRLNGASTASVRLDRDERLVRLQGEGFFEVAPDKVRPFSVLAEGVRVTAVGTRFNVEDTAQGVEITVYEGAVDVRSGRGDVLRVAAGDRAIVTARKALLIPPARAVSPTGLPSWTEGWIEADETPLAEVIARLERGADAEIFFADEDLGRLLVSGRFRQDRPAETLQGLAAVHQLRVERRGSDRFVLADGAPQGR